MEKKSWNEFKETGLLCFVNTFLHIFGWCIVIEEKYGEAINIYPARVNYTGFSEDVYEKSYEKVRNLLKEPIED